MIDTPTNNFCTLNPISKLVNSAASGTMSEGNLKTHLATPDSENFGTMAVSTGKWYWEVYTAVSAYGTTIAAVDLGSHKGLTVSSGRSYISVGGGTPTVYDVGTESFGGTSTPSVSSTDVLGIALDLDNGAVYTSINGVFSNSGDPTSGASKTGATVTSSIHTKLASGVGEWTPMYVDGGSGDRGIILNCGQDSSFAGNVTAGTETDDNSNGSFKYDVPTGFLALCTSNLTAPAVKPQENFNTVLYAGDSATSHPITGVGFQPDFVWIKGRNDSSYSHQLFLQSDGTGAEGTNTANSGLLSFDSDGFSVGYGSQQAWNYSGKTYVAWNWKAGTAQGSTATTGAGTAKTYSGSYNSDAGFSIMKYDGNATASHTIPHHLSKAPEMVIVKNRIEGHAWYVYHKDIASDAETDVIYLNTGGAAFDFAGWADTAPSTSVVTLGQYNPINENNKSHIMYCFHSVDGYSKVGSFTGNGSADGPFVYTGFRPRYILGKNVTRTTGENWFIYDSERNDYNLTEKRLWADLTALENSSTVGVDFTSNGFKVRHADGMFNNSGDTIIYLAFAEYPFKYANAR